VRAGDLTADHNVQLSLGGSNAISNIQPLCGECNGAKGLATTDYRPEASLA
jgi:5-methylcytosine-specific restriction endonuclease McrA